MVSGGVLVIIMSGGYARGTPGRALPVSSDEFPRRFNSHAVGHVSRCQNKLFTCGAKAIAYAYFIL